MTNLKNCFLGELNFFNITIINYTRKNEKNLLFSIVFGSLGEQNFGAKPNAL